MGQRSIYIWKLKDVLDAESSTARIVAKAQQASISAIWIKVADGASRYANVQGNVGNALHDLVAKAHDKDIKVWGWQVPHCDSATVAKKEGKLLGDLATEFGLDGMISDAEGTAAFFHGGLPEAKAYAAAVRQAADDAGKPLAISSNDIPQNIAGWTPKFMEIAKKCDFNYPQTYYGASPSVVNRVDRAVAANASLTIPFMPVGAGFLGTDEGGCSSASACAEKAREFIRLCNERNFQGYSFWHWGGAPMALWQVLNTVPA
jgi:hypothetical protein